MSADCFLLPPSLVPLAVNESQVRKSSSLLDKLMESHEFQSKRVLSLPLRSPYSDLCLQRAMDFAATGQLNLDACNSQQMMDLAEELKMPSLQEQLQNQMLPKPEPLPGNLFPVMPLPMMNPFLAQLSAFHNLQQNLWLQVLSQAQLATAASSAMEAEETGRRRSGSMRKSTSMDVEEPFDNMGDVIIPSSDKEGWCRNKKYIEKTDAGYMCTVCRKVYGRYNSVSYHVTIYHRNPPIKCDLPGCQFTTREARYIHFHKYYRHSIPLPQTIDQEVYPKIVQKGLSGTRKCPYCRHVSKSPAMLEKHIRRHLTNRDDESSMGPEVIPEVAESPEDSRSRASTLSTMEIDLEESKPRALTL